MITLSVLAAVAIIGLGEASWPDGKYCLPMPGTKKCPSGWQKGVREHDTEDYQGSSYCNVKRQGKVPYNKNLCRNLGWGFCCKTRANYPPTGKTWPKGSYCIFRYGGSCPRDFDEGYIHWDDEDNRNKNGRHGVLPDGQYGRNTRIYFCCRNDPEIIIPPKYYPFVCLPLNILRKKYESLSFLKQKFPTLQDLHKIIPCVKTLPKCEEMLLMRYKGTCPPRMQDYRGPHTGYLQWDTEDSRNADQRIGVFPDGAKTFNSGIKIEFCSYTSNFQNC